MELPFFFLLELGTVPPLAPGVYTGDTGECDHTLYAHT